MDPDIILAIFLDEAILGSLGTCGSSFRSRVIWAIFGVDMGFAKCMYAWDLSKASFGFAWSRNVSRPTWDRTLIGCHMGQGPMHKRTWHLRPPAKWPAQWSSALIPPSYESYEDSKTRSALSLTKRAKLQKRNLLSSWVSGADRVAAIEGCSGSHLSALGAPSKVLVASKLLVASKVLVASTVLVASKVLVALASSGTPKCTSTDLLRVC